MINSVLGFLLIVMGLLIILIFLVVLISIVDQGLDGLITKKIKKRFGGDL